MQANSSLLVATTNAIKLRCTMYGIEPAIKPAATNSKTQTIGILATQGTLTSELFYETTKSLKHKLSNK
jgi:glutamate racemase